MTIGIDQFKNQRQALDLDGTDAIVRLMSDKIRELATEGSIPARIADGQFAVLFSAPIGAAHEKMA